MKTLIIGSGGYLGRTLFQAMHAQHEVYGTHFHNQAFPATTYLNVLNLLDVRQILTDLRPDTVIWTIADMHHEKQLTEYALPNLLCCLAPSCRFLYLSTNVYSDGRGHKAESDPPTYQNPNHPASDYVLAKIQAETLIPQHANHVIIRPGVIYGRDCFGHWDNRMAKMIHALGNRESYSVSATTIATWAEVGFLTKIVTNLASHSYTGILHVGTDRAESGCSMNRKVAASLCLDPLLIIPTKGAAEPIIDNSYDLGLQGRLFPELQPASAY